MTKKDHLDYIKKHGDYSFDCNRIIFEEVEVEIIENYGHWFEALTNGVLESLNEEHKRFVEVSNFRAEPITKFEKAWWKYLKRKEIEVNYKDSLYKEHNLKQDSFYNRDMAKQLRKQMYGVMNENHRK